MATSTKRRGLGKGLEALLSGVQSDLELPVAERKKAATNSAKAESALKELPVEKLERGAYQPRRDMDSEALESLAASIRSQGMVQPIVVRSLPKQRFEIIAGERRWRAAQMAGLKKVPVIVRQVSDENALAIALIENIQREDLNAIEEALAFQRLIDEFKMTHQSVAEAVGRSRTAVTNLLRLLSLHAGVRTMVENGDLEMGHARALLALKPKQQVEVAQKIIDQALSVREAEKLVKNTLNPPEEKARPAMDPDVKRLQEDLSEKLGARVGIQHHPKGKGKIVIAYHSLDELEGILSHMQ